MLCVIRELLIAAKKNTVQKFGIFQNTKQNKNKQTFDNQYINKKKKNEKGKLC